MNRLIFSKSSAKSTLILTRARYPFPLSSVEEGSESEKSYQYQNYTRNESLWKPFLSNHYFNKFPQTTSTSAEKTIYNKSIESFFEQIKSMNNQFSSSKSGFFSQTNLTSKVFKQIANLINVSILKTILKFEINTKSHNYWLLNQLDFANKNIKNVIISFFSKHKQIHK